MRASLRAAGTGKLPTCQWQLERRDAVRVTIRVWIPASTVLPSQVATPGPISESSVGPSMISSATFDIDSEDFDHDDIECPFDSDIDVLHLRS
jgi:hypothetical protein